MVSLTSCIKKSFLFLALAISVSAFSQELNSNLIPDSSLSSGIQHWKTFNGNRAQFLGKGYPLDSGYVWMRNKVLLYDTTHYDFVYSRLVQFEYGSSHITSDVIYCQLNQPLVKDSVYDISFMVFPAEFISVPFIQVYLSDRKYSQANKITNGNRLDLYLRDSSQVTNKLTSIRKTGKSEVGNFGSDKWIFTFENKWLRVSGKYRAHGGGTIYLYRQYFTLQLCCIF